MSDNVVQGPWSQPIPQSVREKQDRVALENFTRELVGNAVADLFDTLAETGFEIDILDDMCYDKDIALMTECIRSYVMKHNKQYHPVQDIADAFFETQNDDSLKSVMSMDIIFRGRITPE